MNKIFKKIVFIFLVIFSIYSNVGSEEEKLKIGILVPLSGDNRELGESIIKATRLAIQDINVNKLEMYPRDTGSNPTQALKAAKELREMGINIIIGPIFYKSLAYLDEVENMTFISLTNKTIKLPRNVISAGVNASSQIEAIKKFIELNEIKKTIFLTPKLSYE